ncbi:polymorphic toxin type 50 domain-containing protein [Actinopolymorpha alba]|uniref:polymorphic toxin type 50 domain-containing protein n=1 Tax=Actinopolymorpha alba TaxID=533267 RepID=UPI0012F689E3|nr:polymorphic toxin type 50 domain-containing protein [Actinopolymorpha alba]
MSYDILICQMTLRDCAAGVVDTAKAVAKDSMLLVDSIRAQANEALDGLEAGNLEPTGRFLAGMLGGKGLGRARGILAGVPKIHPGKQGKHIVGDKNFKPGRSELTADPNVLAQRAGTGDPVGSKPRGEPGFKERVNYGTEIGTWVNGTRRLPTTVGMIIYDAKGMIHIVPARPVQ